MSCYGARSTNDCLTCDDVKNAYQARGWAYNTGNIAQCSGTCYGAKSTNDCYTCAQVKTAYQNKGWAYNAGTFRQCPEYNGPAQLDEEIQDVSEIDEDYLDAEMDAADDALEFVADAATAEAFADFSE
eukprot:tig00020553_g10568.t1